MGPLSTTITIPLDPNQINTLQVQATDQLGNAVTKSIMVTQAPVPPITRKMVTVSGNAQSASMNSVLAQPVVVQVYAEDGVSPLADKWVTFEVTRSNGRLGVSAASLIPSQSNPDPGKMWYQVQTDAGGLAQAFWRLGSDAGEGNNRVRVTATEVAGTVEFCATANPGPIKQINVGMGNNQFVEINAPAPELLRAWVSDGCNGISDAPVTFTVTKGDGKVNGQNSITVNTTITGHAQVSFRAGPTPGTNRIAAGVTGINPSATIVAYAVQRNPIQPTSFTGSVLDNGAQPIQGAECTLTINDTLVGTVYSDINGQFRFDNIPETLSGAAGLTVDGFPATHIGGYPGVDVAPQSFPSLHYETVVIPNIENSMPTPIRLPRLDECNRAYYSQGVDTILTIRRRNLTVTNPTDPNYCVSSMDGLKFRVKAGSMTIDGQPAPDGSLLMLNQVHFDDIPMPLPDGAAPPFAGTLWPPNARFDPPISIQYPNMAGLPPGAISYFLSFDHDTSRFEIVGSGHVILDGSLIVSDPGSGIPHGGWHNNCPPYSVTGDCEHCEGDECCDSRCCDGDPCCESPDPCCDSSDPCCGNSHRCCNIDNPCCGSEDPCCNANDACCGNSDRCCNPDNPCCGSGDPCCNVNDSCCGNSNRCCNPDNPCCGSSDPCCNTNSSCCGNPDPCCNPDNPCCMAAAAEGTAVPCCDTNDPCCNDEDPCCGRDCDDGKPCTDDICTDSGECEHPCLGNCTSCGDDAVCMGCECGTGTCSLQVESGSVCPGGQIELELTASCNPDCGPMNFSMEKSVQYLDVTLPGSVPCDGNSHVRTVTVQIDPNAPPTNRTFTVIGTTPVTECQTSAVIMIVEYASLTFQGLANEDEIDPGGFLCVNDDDDNDNDIADKGDTGPTTNENDLKSLELSMKPGGTQSGTVLLTCESGCDKVKFYENPDRSNPFPLPRQWTVPHPDLPKTIYVEGINKSLSPRDVTLKARFTGGGNECEDLINLTVVGFGSIIPDTPTKFLISVLHGGGYPSVQQTTDRKIRIKATLQPPIVGQKVYFRSFDPDDKSPYEADSLGDDNRHATFRRGNLEVPAGFAEVAGSRQLDANGNVIELGVVSTTGGAAEVDLQTTDRYSGDNYVVASHCGPKPALTNVKTAILVAWKRVYLERDSMYTKGGTITTSFAPDANTADDMLTLDSTVDFTAGDMITVFSPTSNIATIVNAKSASTITVPDLPSAFARFSGVRLTADTSTYTVTTSLLPAAYGADAEGTDGGTFVEYMDAPSGSGGIPKYTSLPADGDVTSMSFCTFWFANATSSSNVFQLVAAYKHIDGSFGTTSGPMNISFITTGNFSFGATNQAAIDETAVHEIAHQFAVANGHVDMFVVAPNYLMTDDCVMTYHRVRDNNIVEFETDCFYDIRDQTDAP